MSRGNVNVEELRRSLKEKTEAFKQKVTPLITTSGETPLGLALKTFNLSAENNQQYQLYMWTLTLMEQRNSPANVTEHGIQGKIRELFDIEISLFNKEGDATKELLQIQKVLKHQDVARAFMGLEIDSLKPGDYMALKKTFFNRLEDVCTLKIEAKQENQPWDEGAIRDLLTKLDFLLYAKDLVTEARDNAGPIFKPGQYIPPTQTGVAMALASEKHNGAIVKRSPSSPTPLASPLTTTPSMPSTTPASPGSLNQSPVDPTQENSGKPRF